MVELAVHVKKLDELHLRLAEQRAELFSVINRAKLDEQMYGRIIEDNNKEIEDLKNQVQRLKKYADAYQRAS